MATKNNTQKTFDGDTSLKSNGGPEEAEGFESELPEYEKHPDENKKPKNLEKLAKEDINISILKTPTMNTEKENIFDKLYDSIMESDDFPPADDQNPFDDGLGDDEGGDEFGGEEEVTVTLDKELAQKLYDALGEMLEPGDDAELEDLDGEDEFGDEESGGMNPFEDSVEVQAEPKNLPDTNLKSGNNSNKQNKVKASGYHGKGGKAQSGKVPEPQGDPKELPDSAMKSGNNSNMASNKVTAAGYNSGELIK